MLSVWIFVDLYSLGTQYQFICLTTLYSCKGCLLFFSVVRWSEILWFKANFCLWCYPQPIIQIDFYILFKHIRTTTHQDNSPSYRYWSWWVDLMVYCSLGAHILQDQWVNLMVYCSLGAHILQDQWVNLMVYCSLGAHILQDQWVNLMVYCSLGPIYCRTNEWI